MSQDDYCLVEAARVAHENKILQAQENKTLAEEDSKPLNSTDDSIDYRRSEVKTSD